MEGEMEGVGGGDFNGYCYFMVNFFSNIAPTDCYVESSNVVARYSIPCKL